MLCVKIAEIVRTVCEREGITPSHLQGTIVHRPLIPIRWEIWWAAHELGNSYPKIARIFNVHHTGVMWGVHRHEDALMRRTGNPDYLPNPPLFKKAFLMNRAYGFVHSSDEDRT